MPTFATGIIYPPRSWEELEDITLDIFKHKWRDPHAERNGRTGQPQHGTDIFGQPYYLQGKYAGIQCKRFNETRLTETKIKIELAKAEKFQPPLFEYIIVTTEARDAKVQESVRKINTERLANGQFPVQVVFWDDLLSSYLAEPDYRHVLRKFFQKHYPDLINLVSEIVLSPSTTFQFSAEQELKLEFITLQDRHIQQRWEILKKEANDGYREAIQQEVADLVSEMESVVPHTPINPELQGQVYRLAANVFLPNRPGGDVKRCKTYLLKARGFSRSDEGLIKCQIMEALLAYQSHSLEVALALVDELDTEEVDRFRFSLYLENNDITLCATLLEKYNEAELVNSKDWLRLLVLYYAAIGDRAKVEEMSARLLTGLSHADQFMMAGFAWARLAYRAYKQFCDDNHVCPVIHIELTLDELIDVAARQRAVEMFVKAFEINREKSCVVTARQALLSAIRLEMDEWPHSERFNHLLQQLTEISPQHPLIVILRKNEVESSTSISAEVVTEQLKKLLTDAETDVTLALGLALQVSEANEASTKRVTNLLIEHQTRFEHDDVTMVQFLYKVFQLHLQTGSHSEAKSWIESLTLPEPYSHLRLLWLFLFFAQHDPTLALDYLEQALVQFPKHPELLAVATKFFWGQGDYQRQLASARELFAILPTSSIAVSLLNALLTAQHYEEFLQVVGKFENLPLPEEVLKSSCAHAYIRLGQPQRALEPLEWLYHQHKAKFNELMNLARVYQFLGRWPEVFSVLRTCIERHPEEPEAYLELSQVYLDAGQRNESFHWALKARSRFRHNALVALHLLHISHLTGFEHRPDVRKAFQEFAPGGRFESKGYMRSASLEEIKTLFQSQRDFSTDLATLYRQGKISSMMLCHAQAGFPNAFFRWHVIGTHFKFPRYAAAGDHSFDATSLKRINPSEVVLDYTAILTLWSLYRDEWLDIVRQSFRQVWVSDKLLLIMASEQRLMRQYGQLSQYKIQTTIRNIIERHSSKFHIHPSVDPSDSWGLTGIQTETKIATEKNLPYLNDYDQDEWLPTVLNVGLRRVARVLKKSGEIDNKIHSQLTRQARRRTHFENRLALPRDSSLVIAMPDLTTIVQAGALEAFCNYFGEIHLSEPAWQKVLAQIAEFELTDELVQELRQLQGMLGEAIQAGFVQVAALPPGQQLLWSIQDEEEDTTGEERHPSKDIKRLSFEYLEDLLWLAHSKQFPLWADDRWMSKLYPPERKPPLIFGTDSFLEWARSKFSGDDYFDKYSHLVEWAYLGLPPNPNYVLWLLKQKLQPDAKPLTSVLALYRQYLLEIWEATRSSEFEISAGFGTKLLGLYNQASVLILFRCFENGISLKTCADLFRYLDLTRYTSLAQGNEPLYFGGLLFDAAMGDWLGQIDNTGNQEVNHRLSVNFVRWLDKVMHGAGVIPETLQEAWYQILHTPIVMNKEAKQQRDRLTATLFAQRLFDAAPNYVKTYLMTTELEPMMRQAFGFGTQYSIIFTNSEGEIQASIPSGKWGEDVRRAIACFLTNQSPEPITIGAATIRANWLAPGSIFLQYRELPSEIYRDQPEAQFLEADPISVLSYAISESVEERLGFWSQGLQKLELVNHRLDEWLTLRKGVEVEPLAEVVKVGRQLQSYLLGQLAIAKNYFTEATELGPQAVKHLVDNIEPEVVRRWLDMPPLNWETSDSLTTWAKIRLATRLPDVENTITIDLLLNSYSDFGYSIFPDASVWQQTILQGLENCNLAELQSIVDALWKFSEKSCSMPLKANILLSLLHLEQKCDNTEFQANMAGRIHQLIEDVVSPLKTRENVEEDRSCRKLEQTLCNYLYEAWLTEGTSDHSSLRELAYLAYLGSAYITDALVSSSFITPRLIESLIRELIAWPANWTVEDVALQPQGVFKPGWGLNLNYAFAYLLESSIQRRLNLGKFAVNPAVRRAFLDAGTFHRIVQTYIPNLRPEEDWLDSLLITDIGQGVAYILTTAFGDELETWPEEEKVKFEICNTPETGVMMVINRLKNFLTADEDEVSHAVAMSFVSGPAWSDATYWLVEFLLYSDVLSQIMRFPKAYEELVGQLLYLLATSQTLPGELESQIRQIVFNLPPKRDNIGDLIEAQAVVLAWAVGFTKYSKEIVAWLRALMSNKTIEVSIVRRSLTPFIRLWPDYPEEVVQTIRETLADMAKIPRFSNLWELKRLSRNLIASPLDQLELGPKSQLLIEDQ